MQNLLVIIVATNIKLEIHFYFGQNLHSFKDIYLEYPEISSKFTGVAIIVNDLLINSKINNCENTNTFQSRKKIQLFSTKN